MPITPPSGVPRVFEDGNSSPPRVTILLNLGHPSTRERESLRGLPPVAREQPYGLPSAPEIRLQERERQPWGHCTANPHHHAGVIGCLAPPGPEETDP